jgi:alkanesulfonate monooxygenase SsuD/methylene tetrahydromethanopterin reductase-like flavin-dependent oxidoreductase (luciferase family)
VPPLRALVDEICRDVGRDPHAVERTVAVQVRLPGGRGRVHGGNTKEGPLPLVGSPEVLAEGLRAYPREGIGEVQLVLDPITLASLDEFAPVLEILDRT